MIVVWFKRDLRIKDHQPLFEAANSGEILPVYLLSPEYWESCVYQRRHLEFTKESLDQLNDNLEKLGGRLFTFAGSAADMFQELHALYGDFKIFTYNDFGEESPYSKEAGRWAEEQGISIKEFHRVDETLSIKPAKWKKQMLEQQFLPDIQSIQLPASLPDFPHRRNSRKYNIEIKGDKIHFGQQGGETRALETLSVFLQERLATFAEGLGDPISAANMSSRLSPYLSHGDLSISTIFREIKNSEYCHNLFHGKHFDFFVKKLHKYYLSQRETEAWSPQMEADTYSSLAKPESEHLLSSFLQGMTGLPLLDASIRCLHKTGWVDERLRGLQVSFLVHVLGESWEVAVRKLGPLFLDFDPVIFQREAMLAAGGKKLTASHIVHPVAFSKKIDPQGRFIKRYLPELKNLPENYIHEPWKYPGFYTLGYQPPIVEIDKIIRQMKLYLKETAEKEKAKEGPEQLQFDI
ncbi:hypothetical protein GJU40_14650 [Bacillus lacus]|uniref:Photolyase/cryptochrome alpha/beta domain-containing protein n=1 Tax=Metabacillus lacus TaxID=1983721 RepID=A0A7X2LZG0_9BACI|nr:FAD-binding domain-containing protein [Metabacillus lacus]MRX73386.1 hypothetical protein [Metabacillus lacus]